MIGYPNGKSKKTTTSTYIKHDGRGMDLETELNQSNQYYRDIGKALIHKKPTPVQIVKVDYPSRNCAKITEAYYKVPSTTDYNGIYRGKAIDFEAKETKSKTSFPLRNIHPHQIEHLRQVRKHGGIGFIILRFSWYDEIYLLDAQYMIHLYDDEAIKSISYKKIKEHGSLIKQGLTPRLRYLDNVDALYFKEDNCE